MSQSVGVVVLVCISAAFAGVLSISACGAGGLDNSLRAVVPQCVYGIRGVLIIAVSAGVNGVARLDAGRRDRLGGVCMLVSF